MKRLFGSVDNDQEPPSLGHLKHSKNDQLPANPLNQAHGQPQPQMGQQDGFPPPASRPDAKSQRYDRQLRLWADQGQNKLESATISIGPANSTTSQILKNLILPGIGCFKLFDSGLVTPADLGNNFFLDRAKSLNFNRAREVSQKLIELNPNVRFVVVEGDLITDQDSWVEDCFSSSSLVVATRLNQVDEVRLARECWKRNKHLVLAQTCGFMAQIRIQVRELAIIESHPESLVDLRLDNPFPALLEYVNSFDFHSIDSYEHAHIPAVVILIYFLNTFKLNHSNKLPRNSAEREELKRMILAEKRNVDEENFDEAVGMIWKACKTTTIPSSIQSLFADPCCENLTANSSPFWILVRTLREFVNRSSTSQPPMLPLAGVLPDMQTDTKSYILLQRIYRERALEDLKKFNKILGEVLATLPVDGQGLISDDLVKSFVKHASHLKLYRGRPLEQELQEPHCLASRFVAECDAHVQATESGQPQCSFDSGVSLYLAFRVISTFRSLHEGRYPGEVGGEVETDWNEVVRLSKQLLNRVVWNDACPDCDLPPALWGFLKEMVRAGGSELPQISALIGGMVSQEAIKLISEQYLPMVGTCLFDGISSKSYTFEF